MDIKQAFDSAWWTAILNSLSINGCPKNIWQLLRSFLENRSSILDFEDEIYNFHLERGCPQGSSLSPILWNILFNDIFKIRLPPQAQLQGYADDLILSISGNKETIERDFYRSMSAIRRWCDNKLLTFNFQKFNACLFTTKYKPPNIVIKIDNIIIPIDPTIKILGVILDKKLTFRPHIDTTASKIKGILNNLIMCCKNSFGLSAKNVRLIYLTLIQPIFTYAAGSWWPEKPPQNLLQPFKSIQRLFAIRAIRGFNSLSHESALALAGLIPIDIIMDEK